MRVCHNLSAGFDDPNLVSCAGLIPVMTLAERAGLHGLAAAHVRVPGSAGSNPDVKVTALVAGMVAGADTIDAMDLLRHGGRGRVFSPGRAPSALGTFLRAFTFGHVRQLDAVASSWRTWPKVNARRNVPSVEGARTAVNSRPMAPWRSRSILLMLSAPAIIPAISATTLVTGFDPAVPGTRTCSPINWCRPARSANDTTGTRPAHETRFGSSKTAEPLWQTRT